MHVVNNEHYGCCLLGYLCWHKHKHIVRSKTKNTSLSRLKMSCSEINQMQYNKAGNSDFQVLKYECCPPSSQWISLSKFQTEFWGVGSCFVVLYEDYNRQYFRTPLGLVEFWIRSYTSLTHALCLRHKASRFPFGVTFNNGRNIVEYTRVKKGNSRENVIKLIKIPSNPTNRQSSQLTRNNFEFSVLEVYII
jgi:hypothetical protein